MDQLYSRTEMPQGEAEQAPLDPAAQAPGAGIMSALPHRRAQRRSALRATAVAPAPVQDPLPAPQARPEAAEERHLRAVSSPADPVPGPPRGRRKTLPPPREPAPGIARLAVDGVVESVKFPWRVAAVLAREAAGSVSGALRR